MILQSLLCLKLKYRILTSTAEPSGMKLAGKSMKYKDSWEFLSVLQVFKLSLFLK